VTKKLTLMPRFHPGEDLFEGYIFDRFSDSETADFEEHLLLCELCQGKLAQAEEYVGLIKAATSEYVRNTALEMKAMGDAEPENIPNDEENVINVEHVLPEHPGNNWPGIDKDMASAAEREAVKALENHRKIHGC